MSSLQTFSPILCLMIFSLKIVALNKTKERMRPYHVNHENEDPDIKKIKKVNRLFSAILFQVEIRFHVFFFYVLFTVCAVCSVCLTVSKLPCLYLFRCRVSCEAGSVGGSGRSLFRTTSALLTLRA